MRKKPPTPINSAALAVIPPRPKDIELPLNLRDKAVTRKSITKGTFQGKLLAHYAPQMLVKLFNSFLRNLEAGDVQTQRQAAEMYQLLSSGKGGGLVNVTQQNITQANANATARAAALASGPSDIESILRVVHEDQGNAEARNRTIEVTPEGAA